MDGRIDSSYGVFIFSYSGVFLLKAGKVTRLSEREPVEVGRGGFYFKFDFVVDLAASSIERSVFKFC